MNVISISKDRKRAEVVCRQHGDTVTRHAVRIAGTNRYTIWNRPSWMRPDDQRVQLTTITISDINTVTEDSTV